MAKIFAYLRVSTDQQDVDNQRHGILEYANRRGLSGMEYVEDTASGKVNWRKRELGALLDKMQANDVLIFAEVSRLARSTLQVLEVLEYCTAKKITVHISKQNLVFDGSMQSKIMATVLGMVAEIEREFISMRTKEALAAKKAAGVQLGRPRRPAEKTKLDKHRATIQDLMNKGVSKRSICKIIEAPPSTLYDYIKRHKLKPQKVKENA